MKFCKLHKILYTNEAEICAICDYPLVKFDFSTLPQSGYANTEEREDKK